MGLWAVDHRFGIIIIPKAASNTVANAVRDSGAHFAEVPAFQFKALTPRVGFIRKPRDRIESAYRMYSKTGTAHPHDLSSFENFVLHACKNSHNDPHVYCQMRHLAPKGEPLHTRLIKWDFDALAEFLGVESVGHDFPSDKEVATPWTDRMRMAFDTAYASDNRLWWEG